MSAYRTIGSYMPEHPDIVKFVMPYQKIVIMNLSAKPTANVIYLIYD